PAVSRRRRIPADSAQHEHRYVFNHHLATYYGEPFEAGVAAEFGYLPQHCELSMTTTQPSPGIGLAAAGHLQDRT
ncbi:MAG: hypothetical protein WBD70_13660, partial [Mycobacterium sp.]